MRYSQKYLEEKFTEDELSEIHEGIVGALGKVAGKALKVGGHVIDMGMNSTRPTHASPPGAGPDPYVNRAMRGKEFIKSKLGLGGGESPNQPKIKKPNQSTKQGPKSPTDTTSDITPDRDPETYSATEQAFRKSREKIKFPKTK